MTEKEHLDSLTKNQKRYLSKFSCMWCDHPLNRLGCSAIFDKCSAEKRIKRRNDCLENYKPRKTNANN